MPELTDVQRVLRLVSLLQRGRYSLPLLAEYLRVSEEVVFSDLSAMAEAGLHVFQTSRVGGAVWMMRS